MATESGFSTQLKYGEAQHKTIHNLGSQRYGTSVSTKALSEISAVPLAITGVAVNPKDTREVFLEIVGHNARKHDVVRFTSGANVDYELEIIDVIDADTIKVLNVGTIQVGDTVKPMRWVTSKADKEGNLNFSPGPTTYIKEGVSATVTEDSTTPANNKALPALATIYKDGVQKPISDDDDPSEVVAMPVKRVDTISKSGFASLDFSINSVSDTAYEELYASTPFKVRKVQIFMSSGAPLLLAFGAIGSEQDKLIVIPGGNGFIDFAIPEATRLSVKSMGGIVDSGSLIINFLG